MRWDPIIAGSAFQSACQGLLAQWWEDNLTFDLLTVGTRQIRAPQPITAPSAPLPPPAALAIQDAPAGHRNAASVRDSGNAFGRDPCITCGAGTHAWWSCTTRTGTPLTAHFATILASKGKGQGKGKTKDQGSKGKGGRGYVRTGAGEADAPRDGRSTPDADDGPGRKKKQKNRPASGGRAC